MAILLVGLPVKNCEAAALKEADADVVVVVNGMTCAFCAQGVEKKVRQLNSVDDLFVDMSGEIKKLFLKIKSGQSLTDAEIVKAIREGGYEVPKDGITRKPQKKKSV